MTAHEIHALSGAYAVDALDDAERELFEQHLAECAECRAEVASIQEAGALLGETTVSAPPPSLRDSVLADIRTVRPLPPIGAPAAVEAPASTDELAARRRPRWTRALVAAAAVVAVVGGGTVVWQQVNDSTSGTTSAADRIINASDVKHVAVDLPGGATATVYRSEGLGKAALVTRNMPAAPSGSVYQLWLQKDGQMVPAGLMPAAGDQAVVLKGGADNATAVGITVEPAGGSEHPTTAPIAVFSFEQAT